ncbi:MAG TPA: ATPase domain-containing protein [Longimicrobiaceae bacterium]|nr:ATPase domain-containing protein [Longimicrobiaceae bacterium]
MRSIPSPDGGLVAERLSSGVTGLDDILGGGFPANRVHLILGTPGTGKTTMGLQFLLEGARRGERVLYVTLSETLDEIRSVAQSHGWSLEGITVRELVPSEESLRREAEYTILHPAEVEMGETIRMVLDEVDRTKPTRVVFDSLAELRLLAGDPLRYRREVLGLKQFFAGRRCTVLLLDSAGGREGRESDLASVAHSVLELEQLAPQYGGERRRLRIVKLRGGRYRGGRHDFVIHTGGLMVFPRLVAAEHHESYPSELVSSGVRGLDALLGGGLPRGTSALFVGPAGAGKSVLTTQYAVAAASRGGRAAIYVFDESVQTFVARSDGLGLGLRDLIAAGRIDLQQLDPAQLSPGEFVQHVREAVEERSASVVVVDSLNGYLNAMAEERSMIVQLHELLTYLGQRGVLTLLTVAQHGLVGEIMRAPLDASYLADTVILLRYFEAAGQLRQAISVIKKRVGPHERTIRELKLGPGVQLGEPLRDFQGVLAGLPTFMGTQQSLLNNGGRTDRVVDQVAADLDEAESGYERGHAGQ